MIVRADKFLLLPVGRRERLALLMLVAAGTHGAPVFGPTPRFASCVQRLRRRGLRIATISRNGTDHGVHHHRRHTRFVLVSHVEFVGAPKAGTMSPVVRNGE